MPHAPRRTSAWLNDHPWVYVVPVWLAGVLLLGSLDLEPHWLRSGVMGGLSGLGGVGAMLFLSRAEVRAIGLTKPQLAKLNEHVKRGEAPEGAAERELMRRLIARRSGRLHRRERALPVIALLLLGFCVLTVLSLDPPLSVFGVLLAIALGCAEVWGVRRARSQLDHMHLALSESAGTPPGADER